jgi:uncharacterized membrane protein YwaF
MAALLGTVSCNLTWVTTYKQVSLKQNISFHPACDLACNYDSPIMQMIKSEVVFISKIYWAIILFSNQNLHICQIPVAPYENR